MKKHLLFVLLLLAVAMPEIAAQDTWITLKSGKKEKTLKTDQSQFLELSFNIAGDTLTCGYQSFSGTILSVDDKFIHFQPELETLTTTRADGFSTKYMTKYPAGSTNVTLPLGEIGQIAYRSKSSKGWFDTGGMLTLMGSFTALVVAPLVSIKYDSGGFNHERYFNWSAGGLACVSVGVPLMVFNKKKKFYLRDGSHGKQVWGIGD